MGTSPNLTAVIANYYESRQKYWPQILTAINRSTILPDRMVIWDNLGDWAPSSFRWSGREAIIHSPWNTLLGRYAAIFLCETDYVFVQDNDLVVGPQTIERLFQVARDHQDKIVGVAGCNLAKDTENPYTKASWVKEGPCDVVLGRCWLAHRKALAPGFVRILSENVKPGRCDDIFFSLAGNGGIVVPCEYTNLDEQGEGLSHEPQHFEERDAFARRMLNDRQNR